MILTLDIQQTMMQAKWGICREEIVDAKDNVMERLNKIITEIEEGKLEQFELWISVNFIKISAEKVKHYEKLDCWKLWPRKEDVWQDEWKWKVGE